ATRAASASGHIVSKRYRRRHQPAPPANGGSAMSPPRRARRAKAGATSQPMTPSLPSPNAGGHWACDLAWDLRAKLPADEDFEPVRQPAETVAHLQARA